jgi:hypothetical protein
MFTLNSYTIKIVTELDNKVALQIASSLVL